MDLSPEAYNKSRRPSVNVAPPVVPIQALPVSQLIERVNNEPPLTYTYRGMVHPSVGVIYGPPKSGKTVFAESLLMHITAGLTEFLGEPLVRPNPTVLLVGMEEFYRSRILRNKNQIEYMTTKFGLDPSWVDNFHVIDDNFPRHLHGDQEWCMLEKEIDRLQPAVVVLDSFTRLSTDPIEESTVAQKIMKRLRDLAYSRMITLIVIHHTHKMDDRPLSMFNMAGSRVLSQEFDFMIGINRLLNGTRYLKDIAYRYAPDDSVNVLTFNINDNQVIEAGDYRTERELLKDADLRTLPNNNDILVLEYFMEVTQNDATVSVMTHKLVEKFVTCKTMSTPTLHSSLKRLEEKGHVRKTGIGHYKIVLSN